jgi:hypothetical protein
MIQSGFPRSVLASIAAFATLTFFACSSDSTGPAPQGFVAISAQFQATGAPGVAQVSKMRIVFTRVDAIVALDTTVDITPGELNNVITLTVPMARANAETGEDFTLLFELLTAGGLPVFRGGPTSVHAEPTQPGAASTITLSYIGAGSAAVRVQINPASAIALPGATVDFTALTFDVNDAPVDGALVIWSALDAGVAAAVDPAAGRFVAGNVRGSTQVVATLFNGATAQAALTVQPPASAIAIESGNPQAGTVGTALAQPFVVKVTASDNIGVAGQAVAFSIGSGGGSLSANQATTDAAGLASVTYTPGSTPGNASVQAAAAGLNNSPLTFSATISPGPASSVAFTTQPADAVAGAVLAPILVEVRDAFGNRATSYSGQVTLALDAPPPGVTLDGTLATSAVAGVATFNAVRVIGGAQGLRLRATGAAVAGTALSNTFNITVAVATQLVLTSTPPVGSFTFQLLRVVAEARTAGGIVATQYAGTMIATIVSGPPGGTFLGPDRVAFVNGVAALETSFSTLGQYELIFSAPGLSQAFAPLFNIAPVSVELISGDQQGGAANAPLAQQLVVRVFDPLTALSVPDVQVDWFVTAGGGAVNALAPRSDGNGLSAAIWTLGGAGAQAASAQVGTFPSADFTAVILMLTQLAASLAHR